MVKQQDLSIPILVEDLARYASWPVAEFVAGKTQDDALGRAWVPDDVAREVLAKAEEAWQRDIADRQAHAAYVAAFNERRRAVVDEIHKQDREQSPSSAARTYGLVHEALVEFDEREGAVLGFYEWKDKRPSIKAAR
jgi:hypothetical protein